MAEQNSPIISQQESRKYNQDRSQSRMNSTRGHQRRQCKKFVLCFDGTGNKFSGTDADSNILKIYRMLDRSDNNQFHYYQPGIGTYVVSKSLSHTSRIDRIKSWYAKAKDSAVGTSFSDHVMGGYRFLMRYYLPGDDIYLFGFSRGAYTARFLAEMLDHIGILSAGNEEMCSFAWKTFQKWQCRQENNDEEKKQKRYLLEFMCAFRETFSRPVKPIRFLGLFDTVNSVPRFENAWMERSKFPYTARSTAKVIRHAVAIDERRAKFRQDLISQTKPDRSQLYKRHHKHQHLQNALDAVTHDNEDDEERGRKPSFPTDRRDTLAVPEQFRNHSETAGVRTLSPGYSQHTGVNSAASSVSNLSLEAIQHYEDSESDTEEQDIQEVWFAGCHADIGGGWSLTDGEHVALSHVPLVWIVREAERAGLKFDQEKLHALNCGYEEPTAVPEDPHQAIVPTIEIDPASPSPVTDHPVSPFATGQPETANGTSNGDAEKRGLDGTATDEAMEEKPEQHCFHHLASKFHKHYHHASTQGRIHDVLQFNNGVSHMSVISWNIMEYLPFRRMDLQADGSWKSITWPLPKGETRDIPDNAVIHGSVLWRMEVDESYRPGNLIVGGGGRGVRRAPKDKGMGAWILHRGEGDPVGEVYVRKEKSDRCRSAEAATLFSKRSKEH